MMKRALITFALVSVFPLWLFASGRQVKIPETRLKIVYKETGQPVEWVMIQVFCLRTHLTRAERKEYFQRARAEYEKEIQAGHTIPYEDFSDWRSEQFKSERSCGWRDFLHADNGWITIPEVSNVRMDSYEIEFDPAGGDTNYVVNPPLYNKNPEKYYKLSVAYFNEKTFPKFAALPEKDRVLEAPYIAQCGIPAGTLNPTYEEARFFLATYKIILEHWPELSAALGCGYDHGGGPPYFKSGYWGFMANCCLTMRSYIDPSFHLPGVPVIPAAQRADLLEHARALFCADIKAKQALWGETGVSPDLLEGADLDFFQSLHCECMGVKGLPPCQKKAPKTTPVPPPKRPAADRNSATSPEQPPKKGAARLKKPAAKPGQVKQPAEQKPEATAKPPAKEGKKATPEIVQKEQKKEEGK